MNRLNHHGGDSRVTFGELADRWFASIAPNLKRASASRRGVSLKQLKPYFADTPVRNIAAADCDKWVEQRGPLVSASTFNNERDTLRLVLDYAVRDGVILDNPAAGVARRRMGKSRLVIPTHEQFSALVHSLHKIGSRAREGAELVELLAYSGMRLREATELRWGEVDFERGSFVVTGGELGTKNHEARTVPIFPALRQLLERLAGDGQRAPTDRVISINDARRAISSGCVKANLPHFSHHTLRHYFVSNAIEAGIDFKVIAAWLGHKDGGVLVAKTYGHLRDSHSFEMAKRMTFSVQER